MKDEGSSERPNHYGHGHGSAELGGSVVRPNRQVRSTEPPPNQIALQIMFLTNFQSKSRNFWICAPWVMCSTDSQLIMQAVSQKAAKYANRIKHYFEWKIEEKWARKCSQSVVSKRKSPSCKLWLLKKWNKSSIPKENIFLLVRSRFGHGSVIFVTVRGTVRQNQNL